MPGRLDCDPLTVAGQLVPGVDVGRLPEVGLQAADVLFGDRDASGPRPRCGRPVGVDPKLAAEVSHEPSLGVVDCLDAQRGSLIFKKKIFCYNSDTQLAKSLKVPLLVQNVVGDTWNVVTHALPDPSGGKSGLSFLVFSFFLLPYFSGQVDRCMC